jgi:Tir chaperone protein (CesT) family
MQQSIVERISELLAELGRTYALEDVLFHEGEASWTIGFDAETRIGVAMDEAPEVLSFAVPLVPPPAARAAAVHRLLLRFSYLWRETGGLVAALDARGGPVMMFRCALAQLDPTALYGLLQGLAAQRRAWAVLVTSDAEEFEAKKDLMPLGGIRV